MRKIHLDPNDPWYPWIEFVVREQEEWDDNKDKDERKLPIYDQMKKLCKTKGLLGDVIALACSASKWHPANPYIGVTACGCCIRYTTSKGATSCSDCPLDGYGASCISGGVDVVFERILRIYGEHYNRLMDIQKKAELYYLLSE